MQENIFGTLQTVNIGLNTGWDPRTRSFFSQAVQDAYQFSNENIELSAMRLEELDSLENFLATDDSLLLNEFKHVSVHGPKKPSDISQEEWHSIIEKLSALPDIIERIVIHPDEIEDEDIDKWQELGSGLCIENMDPRKLSCQTTKDLKIMFEKLPEATFCFDVAHLSIVDPSLKEGFLMLDEFLEKENRLREVHLSGINKDSSHRLLEVEDLELYWPLLKICTHVPFTLEAPPSFELF